MNTESDHFSTRKLDLLHGVSDLVEKCDLWLDIARLGMTREFIQQKHDFYSRVMMELDYIEKHAPGVSADVKLLKNRVAVLSLEEQRILGEQRKAEAA